MSNFDNLKINKSNIKKISFKELSIIKNIIFWVDSISCEQTNKNAIFVRPFNDKNAIPQQLTGDNFYIKSNFHGYGGKSYQCIEVNDQIYIIWIDQLSKALWLQIFKVQDLSNSIKLLKSRQKKSILISLVREQQEKVLAVFFK